MTNETSNGLTRRQVIERALVATGWASLVGSSTVSAACTTRPSTDNGNGIGSFTVNDIAWLDEVAETILPQTQTPGAKAAGVGPFIALMVTDTYSPQKQVAFRQGMDELEKVSVAKYDQGFIALSDTQRLQLLTELDEARFNQAQTDPDAAPHYFEAIKGLTILGYFTSEIGYTQAMRYVESPGRFDPCVDYTTGETTWARHA